MALYKAVGPTEMLGKGRPLNHIGIEVDDLDLTETRVIAAGLKPFSHGDYHPGRRFYFFDPDGIEYEIISYADTGEIRDRSSGDDALISASSPT